MKVLVTGANGFVASHVVRLLLEKGYHVRGTVRDVANKGKVGHLSALPHAADHLELVQADLLKEGAFDEAVVGCSGVFHTASPFFFKDVTDPEAQLLRPAEEGTLNVLRSIHKGGHKPRTVLTSSIAAIYINGGRTPKDHVFMEDDWSDIDFMRAHKIWYPLSKTLAERAAWDFVAALAEEHKFDLRVVNPVLVTGEMLQQPLNTSSDAVKQYIDGSRKEIQTSCMSFVDVTEVATAHLLAFEGDTSGRHLCAGGEVPYEEVAGRLKALFPEYADKVPTTVAEGKRSTPTAYSTAKLQGLGLQFMPLDETLKNTVAGLKKQGHV